MVVGGVATGGVHECKLECFHDEVFVMLVSVAFIIYYINLSRRDSPMLAVYRNVVIHQAPQQVWVL